MLDQGGSNINTHQVRVRENVPEFLFMDDCGEELGFAIRILNIGDVQYS